MFIAIGQGRIQDFKKEGAQWLLGLAPKTFLANLGDFLKNLGQKGVGVRPLRSPSGSALVGLCEGPCDDAWKITITRHVSMLSIQVLEN